MKYIKNLIQLHSSTPYTTPYSVAHHSPPSGKQTAVQSFSPPGFYLFPIFFLSHFFVFCCGPDKPENNPEVNSERKMEYRTHKEIIQDLTSPHPGDRRTAILECMETEVKECIPVLRELVAKDPDPGVRSVSAVALGEFQDKPSLPKIVALKKDPDVFPETIVDALSRMGDPRVGGHIVEYLAFSNHSLRLLTVATLENTGSTSQAPKILKMALANKDPDKDKTYAMALGKLKYKPAEKWLIQLVGASENGPTKSAGLLALGRVGSKKATPLLLKELESDFLKGRENAYLSLKSTQDNSAIPKLVELLENSDREIRFYSAGIIATLPSPKNREMIRSVFARKNPLSLAPSARILGEWKDEKSRKPIEEALLDTASPDREELARSLGWIGNSESEPVLWKVLEESSGEARHGAAWALGFAGTEKSVDRLITASKSKDQLLAINALESLGQLKSPKSLDSLVESSNSDNLAAFAIPAINQIPGEEARKALEKQAQSRSTIRKKLAIEALGRRGDEASLPLLEKIASSDDPEMRKIAKFAVKNLRSKN